MEEAYNELYQQFLRLRSLCLQQAALLHQLSTDLQKQQGQGVSASNGALGDLMHIPVQCTQEIPTCTQEKPQPLAAVPLVQKPAEHRNPSRNVGTWDLLAEDMSELSLEGTYQRMPVEGGAPLVGLSDALLMSEVALQSHVCEFCQAIFPGDTTTRGDFLRHLYTHVT